MPRPRKDEPQSAATARIESAFWRLLEEVGYPEITVRRVSQAAGTNRNSFYYHYDGLEDLARRAFQSNAADARPLVSSLISGLQGDDARDVRPDGDAVAHAERVMLCARSESAFLRSMVYELLRDAWFDELGIDASRLSEDERVQAEFIFSGLVAVLGSTAVAESPLAMTRLATSRMGRSAIATLRQIAEAQSTGTKPTLRSGTRPAPRGRS